MREKEMKHFFGIAIESFEEKLQLIAEAMQSGFERLDKKIDAVRNELKIDIHLTQAALKGVDRNLSEQIRENRMAIGRIETKLDEIDRRTSRFEELVIPHAV